MNLSDVIIHGTIEQLATALQHVEDVNYLDDYGYTPLIQTAIMDDIEKAKLVIARGADVNLQDIIGNTALHWTTDNNNLEFSRLLLKCKADPNAYTTDGLPVLAKVILNRFNDLKYVLIKHGANVDFAMDYINTKLLGHRFELIGSADIVTTKGRFTEVLYEGFYLPTTIALIRDSLTEFKNNFAARPMRALFNEITAIIDALTVGTQLIKYQHYNTDVSKHAADIKRLFKSEPVILPISQDGHALSLIKHGDIVAICDRMNKEDKRDNVTIYHANNARAWNLDLLHGILYERSSLEFINNELPNILQLDAITTLNIPSQVIGNCSWANIEAAIPTLFFINAYDDNPAPEELINHNANALALYHEWRRWDQDRALSWCVDSFYAADKKRRASKAAVLGAILFQRCHAENPNDLARARKILPCLRTPGYEYIIQSYTELYCNHRQTQIGENFKRLLQRCDETYYDW